MISEPELSAAMPLEASTTRESCFAAFQDRHNSDFSQIFPFLFFGVIKLQGCECQALMRDRQVICPRHPGSWESSTLSTSKPTAENAWGPKQSKDLRLYPLYIDPADQPSLARLLPLQVYRWRL